ncbi:MAG: hypothetical protein KJ726_04700 [Verrucomicrobia bacterium]|nr:hypothetical protein [Verrucomicrobiota bacterium]
MAEQVAELRKWGKGQVVTSTSQGGEKAAPARLTGSVSSSTMSAMVEHFQAEPRGRVSVPPKKRFLISSGALSCVAVLLSACFAQLWICPARAGSVQISDIRLTNGPVALSFRSYRTNTTEWQVFSADGALSAPAWSVVSSNISLPTNSLVDWQDARPVPTDATPRYYALGSAFDDDNDGLYSGTEHFIHRTDWQKRDSDGDGYDDGEEIQNGVDPNNPASPYKSKSMRVDFGLYYPASQYGGSTEGVVGLIVSNAVSWGVDTLYAKAFSYEYGTFWKDPTNTFLFHEGGHGANDILRLFIQQAHQNGIKVVAWVQPALASVGAWQSNATWRMKSSDGNDFDPGRRLLSPFNTNAVRWVVNTMNEILDLGVDGLEVAETDYGAWGTNATYDAAANAAFFQKYPGGALGDTNWRQLRIETLTENVYGQIGGYTRAKGKEFHVTYTWTAASNGSLFAAQDIADNTGFSFDGVMSLTNSSRPHFVQAELIWQQWADTYDNPATFSPAWTFTAATNFVARVNRRAAPVVHVEASTFGSVTPTALQFEQSLRGALTNILCGADFYDHRQVLDNGYGSAVSNAYRGP